MAYWGIGRTMLINSIRRHKVMAQKTCAACDYPLDQNAIAVTIGGKTVDVCCDECAQKLKDAHAAAASAR